MAMEEPRHRSQLEQALPGMEQHGWTNRLSAIRRILAGERDAEALCASLDFADLMIIETILAGLADPASLSDLLPAGDSGP